MAMPLNHIKENISRSFVRLIAARDGFEVRAVDGTEYGVDLTVAEVVGFADGTFESTNRIFEVQLKATTAAGVVQEDGVIKFDLDSTTYNRLVRRLERPVPPMLLVVFVLPESDADWLTVSADVTQIKNCGYWWRPGATDQETTNRRSKRVSIPVKNIVTPDFFSLQLAGYPK